MAPTSSAFIAPTRHTTAESALAQVHHIYNHQIGLLRDHMQRFVAGETLPSHVRACYPYVRIQTDTVARAKPHPDVALLAYGFVAGPGPVSYTPPRGHETSLPPVCRFSLQKKKNP